MSDEFQIDYKLLTIHRNPLFARLQMANEEVRKFIKDRNLIITGGTAIDLALRLKGDHIYNTQSADTALPDYDFYSPTHVKDAYELADLLLSLGIAEQDQQYNYYKIDCIRGLHLQTLRVRLHYESVADVTYVDPIIYNTIPYFIVNGLRVVHPHWQMMNQHHALAYPLIDPPKEVIFNRLNKDITRHEKLYNAYPFPDISMGSDMYKISWDFDMFKDTDIVLQGFSAYAAFYEIYKRFKLSLEDIHPAEINSQYFTSPIDIAEYITSKLPDVKWAAYYEPHMDNSLPIYEIKTDTLVLVHHLDNTIIPVSKFTLEKSKDSLSVLVPESNVVLLCLLLGYHITKKKPIYGKFYNSLMLMIKRMSKHVIDLMNNNQMQKAKDIILNTPFFIPRKLYGAKNESDSFMYQKIKLIRDMQRYAGVMMRGLPIIPLDSYAPSMESRTHTFDYLNSPFFRVGNVRILMNEPPTSTAGGYNSYKAIMFN